ncbi:MAG: hypothetical protein HY376_01675 [Candidatus Blackburnbacteria bacterium]|nr:hypothetical protein [Candidatus Blackburnbacteria bacterium]
MADSIVSPRPSRIISRVAELHRMLEEAGLTLEDLQRPIDDREFRSQLVEFWQSGTKWRFGAGDWETHYGIVPLEVPEFPWSDDILNAPCQFIEGKRVKDTHFAFLGLSGVGSEPLTIMKLHELHPPKRQPRFYVPATEAWYNEQVFATQATCRVRWYLMLAQAVPGSTRKSYQDQKAMLPPEYEVPLVVERATMNLLYYRKFDRYPDTAIWARCQDVDSYDRRVFVHSFSESVDVTHWDDDPRSRIGVAASRKSGA